jgi:hypothetical protein
MTPTVTVELPPEADSAAVDAAVQRWLADTAARGDRVAVDACLCPSLLWDLAARALADGRRYGPPTPAGLAVTLTFPDRRLVVYDGATYTVYATAWDRVMGNGRNTGRSLWF